MSTEGWDEVNRQMALTICVLGQVTCGYQTHGAVSVCPWCGAAR